MVNTLFFHPGKMGDALYSIPAIYGYCFEHRDEAICFSTSDYCEPILSVFNQLSFIDHTFVDKTYKIERMDIGCQPIEPCEVDGFDKVFSLGFPNVPDTNIPDYIGNLIGVKNASQYCLDIFHQAKKKPGNNVVIAPRGLTSFHESFKYLTKTLESFGYNVYIIGGPEDYAGYGINLTGLAMYTSMRLIGTVQTFYGIMSSQLVLANFTKTKKIVLHDGQSWDMRHCLYRDDITYLVNPTKEDLVKEIDGYLMYPNAK